MKEAVKIFVKKALKMFKRGREKRSKEAEKMCKVDVVIRLCLGKWVLGT